MVIVFLWFQFISSNRMEWSKTQDVITVTSWGQLIVTCGSGSDTTTLVTVCLSTGASSLVRSNTWTTQSPDIVFVDLENNNIPYQARLELQVIQIETAFLGITYVQSIPAFRKYINLLENWAVLLKPAGWSAAQWGSGWGDLSTNEGLISDLSTNDIPVIVELGSYKLVDVLTLVL